MRFIHKLIRYFGRELRRTPRPLAYNFHGALRPPLAALLAYMSVKKPGFNLVQVGAHDGQLQDPLGELMERLDFNGVLVEPQPEMCEALQRRYRQSSRVVVVNAAVGPEDSFRSLFRLRPADATAEWMTGIASFDRGHITRALANKPELIEAIQELQVRTITPATLIAEAGVSSIDALLVDVEGYDYEILKLFDVAQSRPAIVRYEHRFLSNADWEESLHMLLKSGYLISHNFEDTIACQGGLLPEW